MLRVGIDPSHGGPVVSTGRSSGRRPSGKASSGKPSSSRTSSGKPSSSRTSSGKASSGKPGPGRSSAPRGSGSRPPGRSPGGRPPTSRQSSGGAGAAKGLGGRQVEGRQAVRELLIAERRKVHEVWISAELEGDAGVADIVEIAAARRIPLLHVARAKLEREARSEAPQGVLAHAAEIPEADLGDLIGARRSGRAASPFLVAVDGVTDPGNLGAIIRTCDAAGVTGVLLPKHRAVHVTPTVAKSAAGAVEYVPMALVPGLPAALRQLTEHGIWVVGLDDGADRGLYDIGSLATEPICLVLGAEGAGLSRLVRERCDSIVGIPMAGHVSSLNVSAAAAVSLYEVSRLRLNVAVSCGDERPPDPHDCRYRRRHHRRLLFDAARSPGVHRGDRWRGGGSHPPVGHRRRGRAGRELLRGCRPAAAV